MDTAISYFCLGGAALFLYKSVTTLSSVVHIYYHTARDINDLRERLGRVEDHLIPLAVAAEQIAKEDAQNNSKDDSSTKSNSSGNCKLDDDWWCLFTRTDPPNKKCD
jgi:hypothetical protein